MFIYRSNRTEELVRRLEEVVKRPTTFPFSPETIVVSSQGMERWLSQELSRRLGILANARFPFPRAFIDELLSPLGDNDFSRETLTWAIAALLPELSRRPGADAIAGYFSQDASDLALFDLARQVADAFDQYVVYRPELVAAWERGEGHGWQPDLFRAVTQRIGAFHLGARARRFLEQRVPDTVPERISIFGVSSLPRVYVRILAKLSREREVHVFVLSPSPDGTETHPLSRSLGAMGRDFEALLLSEAEHARVENVFVSPERRAILQILQADLHLGKNRKAASPDHPRAVARPEDDSILIHSCHGPLREVEVLRDQLLAAFDRDSTLEPHDVVVMTPFIDRYAPLIDAIFARPAGTPGFIPYRIADRTIRSANGVADVVLRAFDLAGGRMTASDVLDFVQLDPMRQRFGFEPEDLPELRRLVSEAAIHWGIDARHRTSLGQPEQQENTWRFGLGRMLLGATMPPDNQRAETFAGLVPLRVSPEDADLAGKLAECCRAVFEWHVTSAEPRPASEWARAVNALLETFVEEGEASIAATRTIRSRTERLVRAAEKVGFGRPIDRAAWASLLEAGLEGETTSRHFASGGVTFCALLPMRSVPFRMVCILGLNDAEFPRKDRAAGFDLIARHPRTGDRSARAEDRQLFLEAILSARDRLHLSYVGKTIHENAEIPPSVVVAELADAIETAFSVRRERPGQLELAFAAASAAPRVLIEHPLQPWSPRYFDSSDPRLVSHVAADADGARALAVGTTSVRRFHAAPLTATEREEVSVAELARFFENPSRGLLRGRLGVALEDEPHLVSDRGPTTLSGLDKYALGADLLQRELRGAPPENTLEWARGSGLLPFGTPGEVELSDVTAEVQALRGRAAHWLEGGRREPLELDITLAGGRITGALRDIYARGHVLVQFGRIRPRTELRAWVYHLALQASGVVARTILLGRSSDRASLIEERTFEPLLTTRAKELLSQLLELRQLGLRAPLCFFPQASREYAERWLRNDGNEKEGARRASDAARAAFDGKRSGISDGDDAYVKRLFAGVDPFETDPVPFDESGELGLPAFGPLALLVFGPLLRGSSTVHA